MAKKTATKIAYDKEYRRIMQIIRRAENKSYVFTETAIPKKLTRPTKRSVEKLKEIKPKDLYKKAVAPDIETGEIIPATEARKKERSASAKKAARTRKIRKAYYDNLAKEQETKTNYESQSRSVAFDEEIIRNVKSYILGFPPQLSDMLISFLNKMIIEQGIEDTATAFILMPDNFKGYLEKYAYDSDSAAHEYASALLNYLPNASEQWKRDASDIFSDYEGIFEE